MDTVGALANKFVAYIVNPAIYVVFALGLFLFVFGVVEFMYEMSKGGETKTGKAHMLWGMVGMFIMVGVFGIISLLNNVFGFGLGPHGSYHPDMSGYRSLPTQSFGY